MNRSTLKLTSHPESVQQVETFLDGLAQKYEISDEVYPNILISLTEAVNNAIHHGNDCDDAKCVHVMTVQKADNRLVFQVRDEGAGFDPAAIPDPTLLENCEKEGGRGVFLMKELSDRLIYRDNGRIVEIQFNVC